MGKPAIAGLGSGYPTENTLLKREMDKILEDPERKRNIKEIEKFFINHLPSKKARPVTRRKK